MVYDVTVIGAGIVGLATALRIKEKNPKLKVSVIEKEAEIAKHQTGNNSGVIHSGIYYKPGSLKAKNCINGYRHLINFCDENGISYELCGKIIVATNEEQLPLLENLRIRGEQNGLKNLRKLTAGELIEYEPHVAGIAGLFVPQTGIIDYNAVTAKYAELFQNLDGEIFLQEKVEGIAKDNGASIIQTTRQHHHTKLVVNCAGLYSDKIARLTQKDVNLKIIPFRGEYYELTEEKHHLVNNLIYPVPDPNFPFLGVHFTRMINGGIEAGPNAVFAFAREGYSKSVINLPELVESLAWPGFQKVASKYWRTGMGEMYRSFSKKAFTKALQQLMPEIQEEDLKPGGAGVRAQACDKDGGLIDDFVILENEMAINVCNAPSPAATSSLSIGETISAIALKRFALN